MAGIEKYGLNWAGKSNAFKAIHTPSSGTLAPQLDESKNWDTTENIFIEGDNLEVLKLLQKHYREKIKMIYIDPPYNTGKDFVYKDNFTQGVADYYEQTGQTQGGIKMTANTEKNGRYHSDWLTMMYPRLFLARNLLREDGVIFISIDDNEVANLRLIMDEIFGEENFVAELALLSNPKGRAQDKYFATNHEYIIVYSKSVQPKGAFEIAKNQEQINMEYSEEDEVGKYRALELRNTHREFGKHNRRNLYYPLYVNTLTREIQLNESEDLVKVLPDWEDGFQGCWTWGKQKAQDDIDFLIGKKVNNNWKIYVKDYANGASKMLKTILADREFYTEKGQKSFNELFGVKEKIFQSPKSVDLLKQLVRTSSADRNDIVLDFFAGSGTTAHAVMDLNAEDGGNRKWICVQLPEVVSEDSEAHKAGYKTIADISRDRIRRAGDKILSDCHSRADGNPGLENLDIGFKSFKLSSSNYRKWTALIDGDTPEALLEQSKLFTESPLVDGYKEIDLVYEIMAKEGLDLNAPIEPFNNSGMQYWRIYDIRCNSNLYITLYDKITQLRIKDMNIQPQDTLVCLDSSLTDTDKVNIGRSVNLKTI